MITQYFMDEKTAWSFALSLDKSLYQVIDYGKKENSFLPYFISYAKR
jgi:hypothetical protein